MLYKEKTPKYVLSNLGNNFLAFKNYMVVINEYIIIVFLKQIELKFIFLQISESIGRVFPYAAAGFQGAHLLS